MNTKEQRVYFIGRKSDKFGFCYQGRGINYFTWLQGYQYYKRYFIKLILLCINFINWLLITIAKL